MSFDVRETWIPLDRHGVLYWGKRIAGFPSRYPNPGIGEVYEFLQNLEKKLKECEGGVF
jgi:hypothetical protein